MATKLTTARLQGIAAAPGLAVGRAFWLRHAASSVERRQVTDVGAELLRLAEARRHARAELEALQAHVAATVSVSEGAIFEAHSAFLDDPVLIDEIEATCRAEGCNVEAAIATVLDSYCELLEQSDDPIFRTRATDLADLKQRLLRLLSGEPTATIELPAGPSILLADDLLPSVAVQLDRSRVLAFCTAAGGPTAHVAILARGLGLPAIVGMGAALDAVPDGARLALDGSTGLLYVEPDTELEEEFAARLAEAHTRRDAERGAAQSPAITRDGQRIAVVANVSSAAEAAEARACGGEGVGLLRTELLFVDRASAPSEDEQVASYRQIADAIGRQPLVIRTLDIGGDKPVAYVRQPAESNPALGVRGIRLALSEPELLRTQVRAIWRIGPGYPVKVMFPMVASLDEIIWLRALVDQIGAELRQAGAAILDALPVGIMVEVPAIALVADQAARLVDFFSIGTNDLTQYTIAVDRTNATVSNIGDAYHPGVLRLIAETARAARAAGVPVSVCGELAGDPLAVALLAGLGIDTLSMSPALIPAAKAVVRQISRAEARERAAKALDLGSARAVRELLAEGYE